MVRLFLFFIFLSSYAVAQPKLLTGSVVVDDGLYSSTASGVYIENLRSFARTRSNEEGNYSIPVNSGDTIQFSADFLETRKIVITTNLYTKGVLKTHLNIAVIELETANIGMSKDLNKYRYKTDDKTILYSRLGLDQRLRDLEPQRDIAKFKPMDVLNPVRLIGHMNGFYRDQRRVRNFENKLELINEVRYYFPETFFTNELHIPEHKINEFLNYVSERYDLKEKALNRQFEQIGFELEPYAITYLKELKGES